MSQIIFVRCADQYGEFSDRKLMKMTDGHRWFQGTSSEVQNERWSQNSNNERTWRIKSIQVANQISKALTLARLCADLVVEANVASGTVTLSTGGVSGAAHSEGAKVATGWTSWGTKPTRRSQHFSQMNVCSNWNSEPYRPFWTMVKWRKPALISRRHQS